MNLRRWVPGIVAGAVACACSGSSVAPLPAVQRPAAARLRLVDVSDRVGLRWRHGAFRWGPAPDPAAMLGAGVCWLDYDDDGRLDLFAVNSYSQQEALRWKERGGLPTSALFRNAGGTFEDVTASSGAGVALRGNGCVAADLDLDHDTDIYVTGASQAALLWNRGNGTFEEGARAAGVEAFGWHSGAAAGDVDGDGWPDLFVAGYVDLNNRIPEATLGFPNTYRGVRDLLYLSNGRDRGGRLTFREVGAEAGVEVVDHEYGLGALMRDFDRDGDLDIYVANDAKPNRLYSNVAWPGGAAADPAGLGFRFEEMAARAGVADPNSGMGVDAGDYDGDGRIDLFVTNARSQLHAVYRGMRPGAATPGFADARDGFGARLDGSTGWGVSWGDLDLDSDLDLVVVNGHVPVTDLDRDAQPIQVFENLAAEGVRARFEEVGRAVGVAAVGPLNARGSAVADYDNDGDLDVAINSIGGRLRLLETTGVVGNWLEVRLAGFHPGAIVTAELADGRRLTREVLAASGYLSSQDPRAHLGLGGAGSVRTLTVTWPSGATTRLEDVAANQIVDVAP